METERKNHFFGLILRNGLGWNRSRGGETLFGSISRNGLRAKMNGILATRLAMLTFHSFRSSEYCASNSLNLSVSCSMSILRFSFCSCSNSLSVDSWRIRSESNCFSNFFSCLTSSALYRFFSDSSNCLILSRS